MNFFVFPFFGITSGRVLAASLDTNDLISLANQERKSRGLGELTKNNDLIRAATAKGNDMFAKQYWAHIGPNGETPWQFILAAGYNYIYAGENLAKNFSTSQEAHLAWMNSPTHRANVLNANYKEVGISIVSGTLDGKSATIIVEMFGSKDNSKAKTNTTNFVNTQPKTTTPIATPTPTPVIPSRSIDSYQPIIQSPANNSVFNNANIKLSGIDEIGDTIKVFSNDQLIGELPKDQDNFTINTTLLELENRIYIKSKDSASQKESLNSDPISINIDTTPPDTNRIVTEIYEQNGLTVLVVKSDEALASVDAQVGIVLTTLTQRDTAFYFGFYQGDNKTVDLFFYDAVGNVSTKRINLDQISKSNGAIPNYINSTTGTNSPVDWINNYFAKFGTKEKINLILVSFFLLMIVIDAVYMIRKGHIREWASHHAFHIALIFILTVGILTI